MINQNNVWALGESDIVAAVYELDVSSVCAVVFCGPGRLTRKM